MSFKNLRRNVIIDCDVGIDDAFALALAFSQKKYNIKLISASCGNLNTDITSRNVLDLEFLFKKDIPVVKGESAPLSGVITVNAAHVHGNNGLGNVILPKGTGILLKELAYEAMYSELVKNGKKGTDIWLLSAATNIAKMLLAHKDAGEFIRRIVVMGASVEGVSNSLEIYDEFNILFDPPAMKILLDSRIDMVFVPMEIGHHCYLRYQDIDKLAALNNTSKKFAEMTKNYHDGHVKIGAAMHDATVVYYALYPKRFEKKICVHTYQTRRKTSWSS